MRKVILRQIIWRLDGMIATLLGTMVNRTEKERQACEQLAGARRLLLEELQEKEVHERQEPTMRYCPHCGGSHSVAALEAVWHCPLEIDCGEEK